VTKIKKTSLDAFRQLGRTTYDVIYVDGSHRAEDVLFDAVAYFSLLKKGGLMVFDDYEWQEIGMHGLDTPRPAIDSFLAIYANSIEVIHKGIQVIVTKKG